MFSVEEVRKRISPEALELFTSIFSAAEMRAIHDAIRMPRVSSFRINTLKGERNSTLAELRAKGIKFRDVPFLPNAFYLDSSEKELLKTPAYECGKIYLQGISGMIPPVVLNPMPGERVLDMAAAPGSKTTQMAALMRGAGEIHAIEPDFIRMERLQHNARILGADGITFHKMRAEKFNPEERESFDKVLCDVPCSGEGRFNLFDKPSYGAWRKRETPGFATLQKKILKRGFEALKVGGKLCYSTCTLNALENEEVLLSMLLEFGDKFEILPLSKHLKPFTEMKAPIVTNPKLKGALRVVPSTQMEGFFIALIEKKASI